MKTSRNGVSAIRQREGCKLVAYLDDAGIWTIGVGHVMKPGDPHVITEAQADTFLTRDLWSAEIAVNTYVKVPLDQNEFDALVSLVFNIGAQEFLNSTALHKLNENDRAGAAEAFLLFNKVRDPKTKKLVIDQGLVNRRATEKVQFMTPVPPRSLMANPGAIAATTTAVASGGSVVSNLVPSEPSQTTSVVSAVTDQVGQVGYQLQMFGVDFHMLKVILGVAAVVGAGIALWQLWEHHKAARFASENM